MSRNVDTKKKGRFRFRPDLGVQRVSVPETSSRQYERNVTVFYFRLSHDAQSEYDRGL